MVARRGTRLASGTPGIEASLPVMRYARREHSRALELDYHEALAVLHSVTELFHLDAVDGVWRAACVDV